MTSHFQTTQTYISFSFSLRLPDEAGAGTIIDNLAEDTNTAQGHTV